MVEWRRKDGRKVVKWKWKVGGMMMKMVKMDDDEMEAEWRRNGGEKWWNGGEMEAKSSEMERRNGGEMEVKCGERNGDEMEVKDEMWWNGGGMEVKSGEMEAKSIFCLKFKNLSK